jgi:hypothetical protein
MKKSIRKPYFNLYDKIKHQLIKEGDCNVCLKYGKKKFYLDLIYCMLPNGIEGYRIEYMHDGLQYSEDLGTIIFSDKTKKWHIINW